MTWILTHTGQQFDLADPQPDMINITDISVALSRLPRFTGHTRGAYSVAQHSVLVSRHVAPEQMLEALLHDAHEAYIGDLSSPLKQVLGDAIRAVENRIDAAIRARFNLPSRLHPHVKHADLCALATEKRDLMPPSPAEWLILEGIHPFANVIKPHDDDRLARVDFMTRLRSIAGAAASLSHRGAA